MFKLNDKIRQMFASERGNSLYERITATMDKYAMNEHLQNGVLVGFSGGADSVMLLSFLSEYVRRNKIATPIVGVHVNHGIRGEEAKRDEDFSVAFAKELGIEISTVSVDVPALAKEEGIGFEEAARNARYSAFSNLIQSRNDISSITVAHNATDNMETVVFNILRGCGISGVAGIKPVRDNIIRPLIQIPKSEIISILEEFGIGYVTDSTNLSNEYTRNYIRNEVLPKFERLSADPERSFSKMTENMLCALDFIDSEAQKIIERIDYEHIDVSMLRDLHPAIFASVITDVVYKKCGVHLEEKHIKCLYTYIQNDNFAFSIPGDYDLICQRGQCLFSPKSTKNFDESMIFPLTYGENKIQGTNLLVYIGENNKTSSNVYNFSIHADIPSAIIDSGLILRLKRNGDTYRYAGITHKLKKVFNDRNIPPYQRGTIPILCDDNGILWVPGLSVRDGVKASLNDAVRITLCYQTPNDGEIEMFTALMRK